MGDMITGSITGKVWVFGPDINTDLVIPNFAVLLPRKEQTQHCFAANRPGWVDEVQPGDILVAGTNFGVGSGRPIGDVFADLGIALIIAESFNGLGLRNCINLGIPCLPAANAASFFAEGDIARVDWKGGGIVNETQGTSMQGQPLPQTLIEIVEAGGVVTILKKEGFLPADAAGASGT
jgi:3-isopropylmalate/(R)-2-methylmalate dehydratase small subunit